MKDKKLNLATQKRVGQMQIDELYFKGLEAEANHEFTKAFELFMQGVALGDSSAQHALGCAYDSGKGVAQDKRTAIMWFKKAWRTSGDSVHINAIALTYIELGQPRQAIYWWNKAIALGDGSCALAFAKYLLEADPQASHSQILSLLQMAVALQPPISISKEEQEEAQELLDGFKTTACKYSI